MWVIVSMVIQCRQGVYVQYYSAGRVYMYSITVQAGCICAVIRCRQGVYVQYYSTGRVYKCSITVHTRTVCISTDVMVTLWPSPAADPNFLACTLSKSLGIYANSCSHTMHYDCWKK